MKASLYFNDIATGGSSDKVYFLALEPYLPASVKKARAGLIPSEETDALNNLFTVTAQYGRRGNALATDCKTKKGPVSHDEAVKLFNKTLKEKLGKGYLHSDSVAPATQVDEVSPDDEQAYFSRRPQELLEEIHDPTPYLTDPAYWMQDKSDGVARGVLKVEDGRIFGYNKLGNVTPLPAELHAELSKLPNRTFHLDGELVGDKLICRDLIDLDGDISQLPYSERFNRLTQLLGSAFSFLEMVTTWTTTDGKILALARQKAERHEGVAFKLTTAPHRSGRNGQHKKFKFIKTLSCVAGDPRANGKDSVEIFLFEKEARVRIGTVSLIGKPPVKEGDVVEVRYLYAYPSKMIVQARLDRVRDDVAPAECTTAQLIFKREE